MNDSIPSVIFLDFDGVIRLALDEGWTGSTGAAFCQIRMKTLREVSQKTGARFVISSDWRHMDNLEEIQRHLSPFLADLLHPDWATPITGHRWNEVALWLIRHPEVTTYAILEDFAPHFEGCPPSMAARLLLCSNRFGLVPEITQRLIRLLSPNERGLATAPQDSD